MKTEPLTDAVLAEIEADAKCLAEAGCGWLLAGPRLFKEHVPALIAEVRRLRSVADFATDCANAFKARDQAAAESAHLLQMLRKCYGQLCDQQAMPDRSNDLSYIAAIEGSSRGVAMLAEMVELRKVAEKARDAVANRRHVADLAVALRKLDARVAANVPE